MLALAKLAKALKVVIPISFFEKDGPRYYNSVAMADADGEILGVYRKSHIPDGPGYQEKYYFRPGDTGFKAWQTQARHDRRRHLLGPMVPGSRARHGARRRRDPVLPDRHRLRAARPDASTRICNGSAPCRATRWRTPCRSSRRTASALEDNDGVSQSYYGHSFIADHTGELVASFGDQDEGVLVQSFDLDEIARYRAEWGFFRDRRTDLYAKSIR